MDAAAAADKLNNYSTVASSRAATMPFGDERTAMLAAAARALSFASALTRTQGAGFPAERFAKIVRQIDDEMADAGAHRIPDQADILISTYDA